VFGRILDHFPYAGLRGEADRRAWAADFAATRRLFRGHFGADIGTEPAASACRAHVDGADCCVGCSKPPTCDTRPRPDRRPAAYGAFHGVNLRSSHAGGGRSLAHYGCLAGPLTCHASPISAQRRITLMDALTQQPDLEPLASYLANKALAR
jgi:hypothetical protein